MGDVTVDVERLREEVQRKYVEVVEHPEREFHFHTGRRAARNNGYLDQWLEGLPEEAVASYAGVANPFHWGLPKPGEHVVDVGSGAGLDALIAARAVGPDGHVIGVG
jgi:arsenite methyltransferase